MTLLTVSAIAQHQSLSFNGFSHKLLFNIGRLMWSSNPYDPVIKVLCSPD